ncbi:MAG: glycosyltransferase family 2 protein [Pseudoxanthomonas sp.]
MWSRKIRLRLDPIHQLGSQASADDIVEYRAEGQDPQFNATPEAGLSALVPGWYQLSIQLQLLDGEIITPCFYPDYGEGLSEATRIDLPEPDDDGRIRCVVLFKGRLRALRFDPTIHRAHFRMEQPRLKRISRPWALLQMLRGIQDVTDRMFWEDAIGALVEFCRLAVKGRISQGADRLVARYQEVHRQQAHGYTHWIALFDSPSPARLERARLRIEGLVRRPLLSLLLPTHNTPVALLRKCIDSVRDQVYENWELCIADDASSASVRRVLNEYAAKDPRIKLHLRAHHGHICEASNDALGLATGEYLGFLDHDDELSPEALGEMVMAIEANPDARLFYSDEDKIDESGKRFDPHFKPAWSPDLLRSQNYLCHFVVLETQLVRMVGGLRPGFEGAQDHDLLLRCVEKLRHDQVVHIPKVLYHWRATAGSTALGGEQKPYSLEAGRRAVEQHLARTGATATVEVTQGGYYNVRRKLDRAAPAVTIVIPTRDRKYLLSACVESILEKTDYPNYHIVVVDNGSVDDDARQYLAELHENPRITVLAYAAPFNFSAIINHAVRHANGEVLCILNNDVEVITRGWLDEMVAEALRPEVGVVGCMLYYPDNTIQHAGVVLGIGGVAGHVHSRLHKGANGYLGRAAVKQNFTALTGACIVLRREVFKEVSGLDESLPVAFNDIDFCMRVARKGYLNVWTPNAELYHHESASRGLENTPEKRARFDLEVSAMQRRWAAQLQQDPAYNPNLTLDGCHFELAFPPRSLPGANRARAAMGNPKGTVSA